MAHNRESVVFNPSSPRSSVGGAESFKGTPDTRLTAFSPEEGSARSSRLLKSLGQDSPDTTPSRFHSIACGGAISNADKDPFITTTSNVALQKLSPTASAFQPFVGPVATPDHVRRRNRNLFSPSQKEEGELSQYLSIWSSSRTLNGADLMSCFTADFEVEYMSEAHFSEHAGQTPMKCGSWVSILAIATPLGVLDISRLEAVVKRHLQAKGHLLAYHTQQVHDEDTYKAVAEFSDASEALSAVVSLDNRIIETTHEEHDGSVEAPGPLLPSQDLTNAFQALAMSKNPTQIGTDVRTTIMLRNIPNKVDQAMLKRIVDESSWGKYDFMYLRIDFANDCNVGYAFINFVDPLDIVDFVNTRGNQRWNCFKSDKVAEISYANNQSKMKRSCENAEHVGLFTPNAGQHFRDEQRRRRSQYDRGTRLAALEEHDFETNMQSYMYHQQ
ncbi:Meiosis protein mei2 [Colletotrichum sp. SAR 10_98]|nr:Meiosis protein mei2 [Colletotrichum sp. SAR 10_96]KAI8265217.1 Meiosis protein mei2 [Colletotrichum sp. SAR 10_98]